MRSARVAVTLAGEAKNPTAGINDQRLGLFLGAHMNSHIEVLKISAVAIKWCCLQMSVQELSLLVASHINPFLESAC
jgi:hypothetical protein